MSDAGELSNNWAGATEGAAVDEAAVRAKEAEAAAGELADRLGELAAQLGDKLRPQRIEFGTGRLWGLLKRKCPEGFVLDAVNLQILLRDGRLWSYSRSDNLRYPAGHYFDVRTAYVNFARGHCFFGGIGFTFLGVVLGKYTFGVADGDGHAQQAYGLCAICTEGKSIRYVDVTKALADIAAGVVLRGPAR